MVEVKTSDALPSGQPGWEIWGRTAKNEFVSLGEYPRLGLGERLLGKYKTYHQVDMREQSTSFSCKARSSTGEMYFTAKFDVTFRLKRDRIPEFLTSEVTIKSAIEDVLVQEAQDISEGFEIENDRGYQAQLKEALDPRFAGSQLVPMFDLVRVNLRAHVPDDVRAETEMWQKIKNLDQRIVTAEADGNKEEANRLREARNAWAEASQVRAEHSIGNANLALEMQKVKNQMIDLDMAPDAEQIRSMDASQKEMVKTGSDGNQAGRESVSQTPKSLDHDPDDLD